jgi:corrinoid protein of di/trimethylamine methyltransferase
MSEVIERLKQAVIDGNDDDATAITKEALEQGSTPLDIVNHGIVAGIQESGRLWKENKYFLPDVIMSAEAFTAAMALVEPLMTSESQVGKVVMGTVAGDMHSLGKAIVIAMLRGAGFEVVDLGVDVPIAAFVDAAAAQKPDILGLGCYMSTTMAEMSAIIDTLKAKGLRGGVKVLIGGVPTSQAFADQVGADAWGMDALDAVNKAMALVGKEVG